MPILDHSFFFSLSNTLTLTLTLLSSFRLPPAQTTQATTHHTQRRTLLPTISNPQPCLLLNKGPGKTSFLLHILLLHPGGSVQPERLTASQLLGRAELGSPVKPPSNHHRVSQRAPKWPRPHETGGKIVCSSGSIGIPIVYLPQYTTVPANPSIRGTWWDGYPCEPRPSKESDPEPINSDWARLGSSERA